MANNSQGKCKNCDEDILKDQKVHKCVRCKGNMHIDCCFDYERPMCGTCVENA